MKTFASSFADPADVSAFKRCVRRGNSEAFCFSVGDNGVGAWGDDTTSLSEAIVAVPKDFIAARFGSWRSRKARGARIWVTIEAPRGVKSTHMCVLKDAMPFLRNIHNGAGIDLAPGAQAAFGLKAPFMVRAEWEWADPPPSLTAKQRMSAKRHGTTAGACLACLS